MNSTNQSSLQPSQDMALTEVVICTSPRNALLPEHVWIQSFHICDFFLLPSPLYLADVDSFGV